MFEKMKSIFSSSGKESIRATGSAAVDKELSSSMISEGGANITNESEVARMEAMDTIKNDSRIKKVYDSFAGRSEMQEKYVQAVMKYGEEVGGYDAAKGEWRKGTFKMEGEETGVKVDAVLAAIMEDELLKKAFKSWTGKVDSKGNNMQDKFKKFVAENPSMGVGYDTKTEEFKKQGYEYNN